MSSPSYSPLTVLDAKAVEQIVTANVPGDPTTIKTAVAIALGIAKIHGIMIVRANPDEYRSHLRFLTQIKWTP